MKIKAKITYFTETNLEALVDYYDKQTDQWFGTERMSLTDPFIPEEIQKIKKNHGIPFALYSYCVLRAHAKAQEKNGQLFEIIEE